jgi:hypothetical protein
MQAKICIADGIDDDSLIGQTVYFEAKRVIAIGETSVKPKTKRRSGGRKPFYDMIPGTVVRAAPGRVAMEVAGGIYSRPMDDVVLEGDLASWMIEHPGAWVMQGGVP